MALAAAQDERNVRGAGEHSVARILVGVKGDVVVEAKSGGLLGAEEHVGQMDVRESLTPIGAETLTVTGRQWKLTSAV